MTSTLSDPVSNLGLPFPQSPCGVEWRKLEGLTPEYVIKG